jgi:hypothetical protein
MDRWFVTWSLETIFLATMFDASATTLGDFVVSVNAGADTVAVDDDDGVTNAFKAKCNDVNDIVVGVLIRKREKEKNNNNLFCLIQLIQIKIEMIDNIKIILTNV